MKKWHGVPILLLLLAGDIGLFRYSEACETVSSIQCVDSTHFLWCVDIGDDVWVTIGDAQVCPAGLVCDDKQAAGCVAADTVTTTELPFETTTVVSTETTILTTDATVTEESSTTELTPDLTTDAPTDATTSNIADLTTTEESPITESTPSLMTTEESPITESTPSLMTTEESPITESTPSLMTTEESPITESTPGLTTSAPTDDTTIIDTSDFTTTEESSIVSDAEFSCTYEGLYRAQDCSRFHVCYKFIWFIKHYFGRCSEGLYWSSVEKRCVLQSLSDCP